MAALDISVQAARHSIVIIENFGQRFGYLQSFFVPHAFTSAIVLLVNVWFGHGDLSETLTEVSKCLTVLEGAQEQLRFFARPERNKAS